jgi:hypothetical protein
LKGSGDWREEGNIGEVKKRRKEEKTPFKGGGYK